MPGACTLEALLFGCEALWTMIGAFTSYVFSALQFGLRVAYDDTNNSLRWLPLFLLTKCSIMSCHSSNLLGPCTV